MKRTIRLALLCSLLAITGCALPHDGRTRPRNADIQVRNDENKEPPPVMSSPMEPHHGFPPAMRPNQASPDGRAVDLRPVRFDRTEAGPGRELIVHYTVTGRPQCNVLGQVHVAETSAAVRVTLLLGRLPGTNCSGPQLQLAAPMMTIVTLREPLGARQVRDGS
jgi:hypothetical protein